MSCCRNSAYIRVRFSRHVGIELILSRSFCNSKRKLQYSVMLWWACCSHISRPLPAQAGCESRERIVLLLVFIA